MQQMEMEEVVFPRSRWFVLFYASFGIVCLYMHMTAIAPIMDVIAADLGVDIGEATQLFTARMLGEAILMIAFASVLDRIGLVKALNIGHAIAAVSVFVTPFICENYYTFLVVRFLQAAAVGLIFPAIAHLVVRWFPEKEYGIANGLFFGALPVGAAIGALLSPYIMNLVNDWKLTLAILGCVDMIGIALSFWVIGKESPVVVDVACDKGNDIEGMSYFQALQHPISWIGALIIFANAWIFFGLTNFVPAFLSAEQPTGAGFGPVTSGYLNLALTLVGLIAVLAGGWLYDRVTKGRAKLLAVIGFICSATAYLLIFSSVQESSWFLIFILLMAGFGMPFQNSAIGAYIVKIYPPEVSGSMIGWWYGAGTFGAFVGLFLGGISISHTGNFDWAIIMITISALVGLLITIFYLNDDLQVVAVAPLESISDQKYFNF